jgi:hypothetical protein
MARPKGWRAVKSRLSYTVEEVARNQGVSRCTVRRWIKTGLACLDDQKPMLIIGSDLIAFLKARAQPKHTCAPDEFFCFRCKAPRKAAFGDIETSLAGAGRRQLRALCPDCATIMHKAAGDRTITALDAMPGVSITPAHEAISKGRQPS